MDAKKHLRPITTVDRAGQIDAWIDRAERLAVVKSRGGFSDHFPDELFFDRFSVERKKNPDSVCSRMYVRDRLDRWLMFLFQV